MKKVSVIAVKAIVVIAFTIATGIAAGAATVATLTGLGITHPLIVAGVAVAFQITAGWTVFTSKQWTQFVLAVHPKKKKKKGKGR